MGSDWIDCTLGDVIELKRGYDLPRQSRRQGGIEIISSSGPTGYHNQAKVTGPGVVTGRYGTLGTVFYVREPFWPLNTTLYVRDFKGNDPRFISYLLRRIDFSAFSDKAAVPGLNRNHLHKARVSIPPNTVEQRAIAQVLGALDDKVSLNQRVVKTIDAIGRALFKAWFVDFEPVLDKLQSRHTGLSGQFASLFPNSIIESNLGEIPASWSLTSLATMAELNPESWKKGSRPDILDYVDLASTKWGRIESITRYDQSPAPTRAQRVLRPGDTIVGTVRPGNGSYALISEEGLTGSTGFAVLRPKTREATEFVYLASTRSENIEALARLADGGAYPAVRPEEVAKTPCVQPTESVLRAFSDCTRPMFARIAQCERESHTLASLRDTLLPKLISGELRIKDAERLVSEVV